MPTSYDSPVATGQLNYPAALDRCPYRRPFPANFSECPTYQAVSFIAADSLGQRLGSRLTCRHLASGDYPEQRGRFYPRCTLGTAADRLYWLARVSQARLEVVRALQEEFDSISQPYREQLLDAKTKLLASPGNRGLRESLERVLVVCREAIGRFLVEREARFEDVGLPIDPLMRLVDRWCRAWANSQTLGAPDGDDVGLRAFQPHFQAFLSAALESPWLQSDKIHPHESAPLYEDSILRISKAVEPAGVRLDGTVDASNVDAMSRTLIANVNGAEEVHLDLSGLLFCDLGGLRAIVHTAQQIGVGRRLVMHGLPSYLERAMALAEWAHVPNIVMAPEQKQS
jgi:hypothetical protein